MPQYRVEIFGYVDIECDNRKQALKLVKQQFEEENLTYEDLSFEITYDSDKDEESD